MLPLYKNKRFIIKFVRGYIPFVSVIIPVYNREKFIERAINSVLKQTYRNFEIIVVNDGSNDNTANILQKYATKIRIMTLPVNKGVSYARNIGIRYAMGEYVAFLDSDDEWLENKLEEQIAYVNRHKQIKILQTEEIWIRNGKRVNPLKKHKKYEGYIYPKCLPLCIISPSSVLIKREILKKVGWFDTSFPACEDYELWLRISSKYPVGLINKKLTIKYGGHEDQLSKKIPHLDKWRIKALLKILNSNFLNKKEKILTQQELLRKLKIYYNGCFKHNKIKEGTQYKKLYDNIKKLSF